MTQKQIFMGDLENMENAAGITAPRCDIWQDRIIYTICVALIHVLRFILKNSNSFNKE